MILCIKISLHYIGLFLFLNYFISLLKIREEISDNKMIICFKLYIISIYNL